MLYAAPNTIILTPLHATLHEPTPLCIHSQCHMYPLSHVHYISYTAISTHLYYSYPRSMALYVFLHAPHRHTYTRMHTHTTHIHLHSSLLHTSTCQLLHVTHTCMHPIQMNRAVMRPGEMTPVPQAVQRAVWLRHQASGWTLALSHGPAPDFSW